MSSPVDKIRGSIRKLTTIEEAEDELNDLPEYLKDFQITNATDFENYTNYLHAIWEKIETLKKATKEDHDVKKLGATFEEFITKIRAISDEKLQALRKLNLNVSEISEETFKKIQENLKNFGGITLNDREHLLKSGPAYTSLYEPSAIPPAPSLAPAPEKTQVMNPEIASIGLKIINLLSDLEKVDKYQSSLKQFLDIFTNFSIRNPELLLYYSTTLAQIAYEINKLKALQASAKQSEIQASFDSFKKDIRANFQEKLQLLQNGSITFDDATLREANSKLTEHGYGIQIPDTLKTPPGTIRRSGTMETTPGAGIATVGTETQRVPLADDRDSKSLGESKAGREPAEEILAESRRLITSSPAKNEAIPESTAQIRQRKTRNLTELGLDEAGPDTADTARPEEGEMGREPGRGATVPGSSGSREEPKPTQPPSYGTLHSGATLSSGLSGAHADFGQLGATGGSIGIGTETGESNGRTLEFGREAEMRRRAEMRKGKSQEKQPKVESPSITEENWQAIKVAFKGKLEEVQGNPNKIIVERTTSVEKTEQGNLSVTTVKVPADEFSLDHMAATFVISSTKLPQPVICNLDSSVKDALILYNAVKLEAQKQTLEDKIIIVLSDRLEKELRSKASTGNADCNKIITEYDADNENRKKQKPSI